MNENPYSSPVVAASPLAAPSIGMGVYLKAFAIHFLMSLILSTGAGFFVGFIVGVLLAGAGIDFARLQLIGGVLGFLVSIPVNFICYRFTVEKFIVRRLMDQRG